MLEWLKSEIDIRASMCNMERELGCCSWQKLASELMGGRLDSYLLCGVADLLHHAIVHDRQAFCQGCHQPQIPTCMSYGFVLVRYLNACVMTTAVWCTSHLILCVLNVS